MDWIISLNIYMLKYHFLSTIVIFQYCIRFRLALEIVRMARLSESPKKIILLAIQFNFLSEVISTRLFHIPMKQGTIPNLSNSSL